MEPYSPPKEKFPPLEEQFWRDLIGEELWTRRTFEEGGTVKTMPYGAATNLADNQGNASENTDLLRPNVSSTVDDEPIQMQIPLYPSEIDVHTNGSDEVKNDNIVVEETTDGGMGLEDNNIQSTKNDQIFRSVEVTPTVAYPVEGNYHGSQNDEKEAGLTNGFINDGQKKSAEMKDEVEEEIPTQMLSVRRRKKLPPPPRFPRNYLKRKARYLKGQLSKNKKSRSFPMGDESGAFDLFM